MVTLPASPNHSSGEALPGFYLEASAPSEPSTMGQLASSPVATDPSSSYLGPLIGSPTTERHPDPSSSFGYLPNIGAVCGDTHSVLAMADRKKKFTNTNLPDGENLDFDGIHVGLETGTSGRRLFMGLGDDQSIQMQEMRHWMQSVEERLAQKSCRKRGRSHSRSETRDSRIQSSRERHPRKRQRSQERLRSRSRRHRTPTPSRRRNDALSKIGSEIFKFKTQFRCS
ncbi:hypothetical protein PIB30_005842 [Stylosanthes scabra]|uniref:Uncharacterized protein n=1 Tax=Stylosanthes scabra TaxID=79078 RepID=A0ABU6Z3U7_9FABA|nr:hypothetical protein [Stylosanthes scabra]